MQKILGWLGIYVPGKMTGVPAGKTLTRLAKNFMNQHLWVYILITIIKYYYICGCLRLSEFVT